MKFRKGQRLTVHDTRKGTYAGVALAAFDTEVDEWFPVAVDQETPVYGMSQAWVPGDSIPCRKGLARVTPRTKARAPKKKAKE